MLGISPAGRIYPWSSTLFALFDLVHPDTNAPAYQCFVTALGHKFSDLDGRTGTKNAKTWPLKNPGKL